MASTTRDRTFRSTRLSNDNRQVTLTKEENALKSTGGDKKLQNVSRERAPSKEQNLKKEQNIKKDQLTPKQQENIQELSRRQTVARIINTPRQENIPSVQTHLQNSKTKFGLQKAKIGQKDSTIPNNQKKEKVRRISLLKQHIDQANRVRRPELNEKHLLTTSQRREGSSTSTEIKERLKELVDIPPKEFEKNFREWMERDDVARALQAKLRADLINEFNKTALGKQIVSVSTTSFVGGGNSGAPALSVFGKLPKPLTLQPLALALHTLVAEFLHAENCHFSLSVFCTEVPYRNALPDFDTRSNFRFLEHEIEILMEALMNSSSLDSRFVELRKSVQRAYLETPHSFLYALIKKLVEVVQQPLRPVEKVMHSVATGTTGTTGGRMASPIQRKVTTSVGTMAKSVVHSTVGTNTAMRCTSTKGTATTPVKVKPKCLSRLTQTQPMPKTASPPSPPSPSTRHQQLKPPLCHKATNTERKRAMVNIALQTAEPELQQLLNGHLITLLRRVRELVVVCEMSMKPHITDGGQLNLSRICLNLDKHTAELTQLRGSVARSSLEKLHDIFTNLRLCTQSLKQVMILRSQASMSTRPATTANKSTLTTRWPALLLDTATQTEPQHLPLTVSVKSEEKLEQQLPPRQTADSGQQTEPSKQTVATNTMLQRTIVKHSVATNTETKEQRSVEQQTLKLPEKTYEEWVHEMTNTPSGQVFLDRVEASLRKALYRQKNKMYKLYDIKLRHHRELLRMRYKRPSVEQVCQSGASNANGEARQLMDVLGKQIGEFETRQQAILDKIKAAELAAQNAMQTLQPKQEAMREAEIRSEAVTKAGPEAAEAEAAAVGTHQSPKIPPTAAVPIELHRELKSQAAKLKRLAMVLRDHLPKTQAVVSPRRRTAHSKPESETKMTQAVAEAKARIQELENESSRLENRFLNYVERMRHEKDAEHEVTRLKRPDCALERECLQKTMRHFKELERHNDQHINNLDRIETTNDLELQQIASECEQKRMVAQHVVNTSAVETKATHGVVFKNAISEAKRKLFDESPWLREEPTTRLLISDQSKLTTETIGTRLKEQVELSIVTQQIAEWHCRNDFVSLHEHSHDGVGDGIAVCGAEQMLRNFKAQPDLEDPAMSMPAKPYYITDLDGIATSTMTSATATTTTALAATTCGGDVHSKKLKLKRLMEHAELNSLTAFLAHQSSDSSNDEDDADDDGVSEKWRKRFQRSGSHIDSTNGSKQLHEHAPTAGLELRLSTSSSSSSSCSSLAEAFDRVYKKHSLIQTGDGGGNNLLPTTPQHMRTMTLASPTLPSTALSSAKPLTSSLPLTFSTASAPAPRATNSSRDKLQRTFAKMQMLFAPQELLGDESQPLELDYSVPSVAQPLNADPFQHGIRTESDSDSDSSSSSRSSNNNDTKIWSTMAKTLH